ncbi:MAG: inositol monophosphatase family protein [Rhodobacter sp.]|nr:inositol monophosphatase family protein [Rhodobacter sp.]MCY4167287.1 inositol monophosphatase family protein [Rhodobacter sp.]MCY4243424.1 inositol monophosphatase family protein [Rhodobacter sp.]
MPGIDSSDRDALIETAHEMADAARAAVLPYFRAWNLEVENKDPNGFDPVTAADRTAERAIRGVLAARRPDDGFLGEEHGTVKGSSGLIWVVDPIDGTRGFISGTPTWGVLIAVGAGNGPLFGLIDQPYIRERFVGGFSEAYTVGPQGRIPLRCRGARELSAATVLTTFPEVGTDAEAKAFHSLASRCNLTRYGMDCYAYALLAAGQIDLVVEAGLEPYDIQAPMAVVEAAGGIVTDWRGGSAHMGGQVLAAANPRIHSAAIEALNS